MLAKRVIPCLDVKDGRVVKGVRFVELRDAGDPVEAALAYDAQGADELVFLDITASHEARDTMLDVVRRTAEGIYMPLTVGGGVRTVDDVRRLLRAGADKVSLNTAALRATRGDSRGGRALRQPVHRGRHRCPTNSGVAPGATYFLEQATCVPTRANGPRYKMARVHARRPPVDRVVTPSPGPRKPSSRARARFF